MKLLSPEPTKSQSRVWVNDARSVAAVSSVTWVSVFCCYLCFVKTSPLWYLSKDQAKLLAVENRAVFKRFSNAISLVNRPFTPPLITKLATTRGTFTKTLKNPSRRLSSAPCACPGLKTLTLKHLATRWVEVSIPESASVRGDVLGELPLLPLLELSPLPVLSNDAHPLRKT